MPSKLLLKLIQCMLTVSDRWLGMAAANSSEASDNDVVPFFESGSEEEDELRLVYVRLQVGTWTDILPAILAGLTRRSSVSGLIFPQYYMELQQQSARFLAMRARALRAEEARVGALAQTLLTIAGRRVEQAAPADGANRGDRG